MSLFEKLYYAADKDLKDTTLKEFKKATHDLVNGGDEPDKAEAKKKLQAIENPQSKTGS